MNYSSESISLIFTLSNFGKSSDHSETRVLYNQNTKKYFIHIILLLIYEDMLELIYISKVTIIINIKCINKYINT